MKAFKQSVKRTLDMRLFFTQVRLMMSDANKIQTQRIFWLDHARGIAVVAMVIFHFTFDLMYFGYIAPGTVYRLEWRIFESTIAASFLFIAGFSFMLSHGGSLKFSRLRRKLGLLAMSAAGISCVTYFIFGPNMIRMGILHSILLLSVLAIFLRHLHWGFLTFLACLNILLYLWLPLPLEASAWLQWLVWTSETEFSVDYRPILPWATPFLIGMVAQRFLPNDRSIITDRAKRLSIIGRNSLWIYLAHQPILFCAFTLYSWLR